MQKPLPFFAVKNLIITLQVFVLIFVFSLIPLQCGFLDPVGQALSDFDLNDLVFSKLREEQPADTNIVLVNIGNLNREGIAGQLEIINSYEPKVIGLDAFFWVLKDSATDKRLQAAMQAAAGKLVLVSKAAGYIAKPERYDSVLTSHSYFNASAANGYANLPDEGAASFRTIRRFRPFVRSADSVIPAFGVKIAQAFNPMTVNKLMERNQEIESINFRGNTNKFYTIDAEDLLQNPEQFEFIRGKIVLMGYMGPDLQTKAFEDIFFTPLNEKYAGKSFPDMYGIVIHANIVSMILQGNYLNYSPLWLNLLAAIVICYLNVYVMLLIKSNISDLFGAITKIMLFLQSIGYLLITVLLFQYNHYKLDITLATVSIFLANTSIDLYEHYLLRIVGKVNRIIKAVSARK